MAGYDLYTYDAFLYDSIPGNGVDVTFIYQNQGTGKVAIFYGNYLDFYKMYEVNINSINDNSTGDLARESIKIHKFAFNSILDKEETINKTNEPSSLVIYGIADKGSYNSYEKIMELTLHPLPMNFRGRMTVSVSNVYFTGQEVAQDLYDDLDTSPSTLTRQVLNYSYWDRSGYHEEEYAGTPRQIVNWLIGGFPFAKDRLTKYGSGINTLVYDEDTIENEKTVYSDGRIAPGAYFNSLWNDNYNDVFALKEFKIEFVDSRNAPLYALTKAIAATIDTVTRTIVNVFNKFFVSLFEIVDFGYWKDVLDTKVYYYTYNIDKTALITSVTKNVYNEVIEIVVDNVDKWPEFGFLQHGLELMQFRVRDNQKLSDFNRHIRGVKSADIVVGDTLKLIGNIRVSENEGLLHKRLRFLMGPKETVTNIQDALNVVVANSENASVEVFDMNITDYSTTAEKRKWSFPKRDIGWFLGSKGYASLPQVDVTYTKATKTLTLSNYQYPLSNISTGDRVYIRYSGDDVVIDGEVFSIDAINDTVTLIDKLLDDAGAEINDFATVRTATFYAIGTSTTRISESVDNDFLQFFPETYLNKELETSGFFHNTYDIDTLYYETTVNENETSLTDVIAAEDTSIYYPASFITESPSGDIILDGTNQRFSYTGNIKSYTLNPMITTKLEGRHPFIVIVNEWNFNDEIINDTVNRLKAIGTTPNVVINKNFHLFRTYIANPEAPFTDMIFSYKNG
jgi:hypothetical protein